MTCSECGREKPVTCYLSHKDTECVACTGRKAGKATEHRIQYYRIKAHEDREASKSNLQKYWESREPKYIPEEWVSEWIKDMRAMVPHLIRDLS